MDNKNKLLMLEIANLEVDAKIGRDCHFFAAYRKNRYRIGLGLFSVTGTAIIASKATKDLFQVLPEFSQYETAFVSVISLLVGVSTAVLGFLGLEKQVTQHRIVGNLYIEVARKARRLFSRMDGGEDVTQIKEDFNKLLLEYLNVNREGESCSVGKQDLLLALKRNGSDGAKIKNKIKRNDDDMLEIETLSPVLHLRKLVINGIRIRLAQFVCFLKIISESECQKYIKQYESN